jgi:hypothetical protein
VIDPADSTENGFSKYFELEKYIALESSDSSVMQTIRKITIAGEKVFIMTWGETQVLTFGMDGRFISQLKKNGRGPGEYDYAVDMSISREGDTVCLFDKELQKLFYYNSKGDFLYNVDLNVDLETFTNFESGNTIGYSYLNRVTPFNDTLYQLWSFDRKGKIINGHLPVSKDCLGDSYGAASTFNRTASGSYFIPYTENVIYRISGNPFRIQPLYRFDFKDRTMPSNILQMGRKERHEAFNRSFLLSGEFVGSKCILLNIDLSEEKLSMVALYDLKNERYSLINSRNLWDDQNEIPIDVNMQNTFLGEDRLIAIADVVKLHGHDFKNKNSIGYKLKENSKVTDNPILLIYKEK